MSRSRRGEWIRSRIKEKESNSFDPESKKQGNETLTLVQIKDGEDGDPTWASHRRGQGTVAQSARRRRTQPRASTRAGEGTGGGATIFLPGCHGRPSVLARCEAREEGEGKENRKEKEGKKETLGIAGRSWRQTEQCAPALVAWWPGQPLADTARRAGEGAREEAPSQRRGRP